MSLFHMRKYGIMLLSRLNIICKSNSTLKMKSARFTTPEHAVNPPMSCLKKSNFNLSESNLLTLHQLQGWRFLTFMTTLPKTNGRKIVL